MIKLWKECLLTFIVRLCSQSAPENLNSLAWHPLVKYQIAKDTRTLILCTCSSMALVGSNMQLQLQSGQDPGKEKRYQAKNPSRGKIIELFLVK